MRKIVHDRENCIGCNSCVLIAPENWEIDTKDGKSTLKNSKKKGKVFVGEIFDHEIPANKKSAKACPMSVIKL